MTSACSHHVPGIVGHVHLHQDVAGEEPRRADDLLAAAHLHDVLGRDQDLADLVLQPEGLHALLEAPSPSSRTPSRCGRCTTASAHRLHSVIMSAQTRPEPFPRTAASEIDVQTEEIDAEERPSTGSRPWWSRRPPSARPGDLLHLVAHFDEEAARASRPAARQRLLLTLAQPSLRSAPRLLLDVRTSPLRTAELAGQEGLEPPTPGFGDRCSTIELLA